MPAVSESNDQIMELTARLKEQIRQSRIAKGLRPDPPERAKFVKVPLALALVERLKPFRTIAIKYTAILAEGGVPIRIDTEKLTEYGRIACLLTRTDNGHCGTIGMGARAALGVMNNVNKAIDGGTADQFDVNATVRCLHIYIGFMDEDRLNSEGYFYDKETGKCSKEERQQLISDPAVYQRAFDEAWAEQERLYGEEGE